MGLLRFDRATRVVPISLTEPREVVPGLFTFDWFAEVMTRNDLVMPYGVVRIQSSARAVRPYLEGRVGFNYLLTRTSVEESDSAVDIERTINFSDIAPSLGGGGGVAVELAEWTDGRFGLDIGARYVYGGQLDYLVPGTRWFDDGASGLELRRSRTDLFMLQLGVWLEF